MKEKENEIKQKHYSLIDNKRYFFFSNPYIDTIDDDIQFKYIENLI